MNYEKPEVVALGQASDAIQAKGQRALDAQPALSGAAYEADEE